MDANGTRYHLLLGKPDWSRCTDEAGIPLLEPTRLPGLAKLAWDKSRSELTLQPLPYQFKAAPSDTPPRLEQRRGAARDRHGNWYWIADSEEEIRVFSSGSGKAGHFWSAADAEQCKTQPRPGLFHPRPDPAPPATQRYRGLCVSEDHYLVVGLLEFPGFLVFDLYGGGPPRELPWPGPGFEPFELAPRPGGGVWILDRRHRALWALDRKFDPVTMLFSPLEPAVPQTFQPERGDPRYQTVRLQPAATSLEALAPVALEPFRADEVLVMDQGGDLYRVCCGGVPLGPLASPSLPGIRMGHDFAYVPLVEPEAVEEGKILGRVYRVTVEGNQAIPFDLLERTDGGLELVPLFRYFPMRRFGGKALVGAGEGAYYDFGERWLPLVEQPRPSYEEEGVFFTPILDGKAPDCVWHRLLLDACLPPEARVRVFSRWSNQESDLETPWPVLSLPDFPAGGSPLDSTGGWEEPPLYPRSSGPELPFLRLPQGYQTWELLFQQARGRYLQLRIELSGNGRVSPRLRALRAYYPRFSYLRYLPALYREEDAKQEHFLERFLANPEGLFTNIEDRIADVQVLFDPQTAPAEALEWLARWLGVVLDPSWDEAKRRLFLRYAAVFFRYRGTVRGLSMALRLALEDCTDQSIFANPDLEGTNAWGVRLLEQFRTRVPPSPLPTPNPSERSLWQDFLARRYRTLERLNAAYKPAQPYANFEQIGFPSSEPPADPVKTDWYRFRRTLLPLARTAHRFTVLLPVRAGEAGAQAKNQERLELARRVVAMESPAHAVYDLRFYWAMFRVGEARLGQDTRVDESSSRVAELMRPMGLGQDYLAQGYLAYLQAPGRWVSDQTALEG